MKRALTTLLVVGVLLSMALPVYAAYPDPGTGKTNIFLQNIGTNPATVSMAFTTGETGGSAGTKNIDTPIPAKGSARVLFTEFPAGVGEGWAGAVEVSATEPLAAIVNVLWDNAGVGSKAAGTYKGVDAPGTAAFVPLLAVRDGFQTSRLTVQNTEDGQATIKIHFYDRNGTYVNSPGLSATIEAKSEKTFALDTVLPNFTATAGLGSAYVECTNGKKIAAVATLHWGPGQSYSSDAYSGVSAGATTLYIPGAFRKFSASCGNGSDTACYANFSVATIQNVGSATANVTIEFWQDTGFKSLTLTDTIPPKASKAYNTAIRGTMTEQQYNDIVANLGSNWRGMIKVISTNSQPLAGVCTFFARSTGVLDNMIYNAIADAEGTSNALSFPAVYRIRGAGARDMWSSTLIQNLSANAGTVTVTFYGSTGSQIPGSWTINIPANGLVGLNLKTQVDLPQAALNAIGTNFSGAMYIQPSSNIRIIGETNICWDGAGRAASYTGFPVP